MKTNYLIYSCMATAMLFTSCIDDEESNYTDNLLHQRELQAQYDLDSKESSLLTSYANAYNTAVQNFQTAANKLASAQQSLAKFIANPEDYSALKEQIDVLAKDIAIENMKIEGYKNYKDYRADLEDLRYQYKELTTRYNYLSYMLSELDYTSDEYKQANKEYNEVSKKRNEISTIISAASTVESLITSSENTLRTKEIQKIKLEAELEYPTFEGTLAALQNLVDANQILVDAAQTIMEKAKAEYENFRKQIGA